MNGDFTTREEVKAVCGRRARNYDIAANLYYLMGFRPLYFGLAYPSVGAAGDKTGPRDLPGTE